MPESASESVGSSQSGPSKAERRTAVEAVEAYHQRCLGELADRVADAVDGRRAGRLDVFEVDQVIHRYHQAARRLWNFCDVASGAGAVITAGLIADMAAAGEAIDWWQQADQRR